MKRTIIICFTLLFSLFLSFPAMAGPITITGSTTVLPIAEKIAKSYMSLHPDAKIQISGGGSGNGIKAIIDGTTDIGNASRFIKDKELGYANGKGVYPVPFRIAYDCIVPIVHPSNTVKSLTVNQLKEIYKGVVKNWRQLGGADSPVHVVSRDTSSGTYEVWENKVMNKEPVFPGVQLESSNDNVLKAVMTDPNAIGYIGLGYMQDSVKAVSVDSIMGSEATTLNGTYPISRPLFMFTRGWPSGDTLEFLNYVLEPGQGQVHVKNAGFVALYTSGSISASQKRAMAPPVAKIADDMNSRANIKLVQAYLNALDYHAGPVDGIKGEKTVAAMMAFQEANQLPMEWNVSEKMMQALLTQYRQVNAEQ